MDDVESTLDSIQGDKPMICLTGGEPLMHPDFYEIAGRVKSKGFFWGMTTNATLIDEEAASKLREAGMSTVSVSLDGMERSHDALRQQKGAFRKALRGLQALQKAGFRPQVTTVLHQGNLLPEFLRHGMSCPFIGLVHFVAEGRRVRIESDCQIIRLFLLQNLKKNIQETVNRSCMSPSRCRQIRQTVKGTVQNAVSVNKNDFSAQCFFSVCLVNAAAKRCL